MCNGQSQLKTNKFRMKYERQNQNMKLRSESGWEWARRRREGGGTEKWRITFYSFRLCNESRITARRTNHWWFYGFFPRANFNCFITHDIAKRFIVCWIRWTELNWKCWCRPLAPNACGQTMKLKMKKRELSSSKWYFASEAETPFASLLRRTQIVWHEGWILEQVDQIVSFSNSIASIVRLKLISYWVLVLCNRPNFQLPPRIFQRNNVLLSFNSNFNLVGGESSESD